MVTWHQENPPPAGVTYEWSGEPHASESIKRVDGVEVARNLLSNPSFESGIDQAGVVSGNSSGATTVTDTTWHGQGSRSIKVIPGTANSSAFYPVTGGGTASPLLTPGKTYTFSALIHLEAQQTGTIFQRARKLTFGIRDENNVPNYDFATSDEAPNAPGTYRLSVTAAIPAGHLAAFLMMANGSNTGPVWFDDAMLEEGVGPGLYFDGDTPDDRAGDVWFRTSDRAAFYWGGIERGWVPHTWDRVFHPLNGTEYAWAGEPHASESIKYVGGVEVARNLSKNPSFEVDVSNLKSRTDGTRIQWSGSPNSAASGDYHSRITFNGEYPNAAWPYVWEDVDVTGGAWLSVEMFARSNVTTAGFTAGIRIEFRNSGGQVSVTNGPMRDLNSRWMSVDLDNPNRDTLTTIVPSTATFARIGYRAELNGSPSDLSGSGLVMFTDALRFQLHGTESEAAEALSKGYFDGDTPDDPSRSGVAEAGVATVDRRGLVGETFARSREKINLQLAEPDERLKGGERIELAAFAASSSEVTWRWRQVTGPEVFLVREGNTCHFQAPDVDDLTDMRIAVSASSVDGANRADWHYFDLEIRPAAGRFAAEGSDGFLPYTPQMVGYNRGKREIWNDVIAPVGMDPEGRKEPKLVDLGIPADDVTFSLDGGEPARASAGAVYVDIQDGAIYRNFGGGYNETDDTTGAPRLNAYMVNPATGEVFEWIEGADNGR